MRVSDLFSRELAAFQCDPKGPDFPDCLCVLCAPESWESRLNGSIWPWCASIILLAKISLCPLNGGLGLCSFKIAESSTPLIH